MVKSSVKVIVRARPSTSQAASSIQFLPDNRTVCINTTSKGIDEKPQQFQFKYDHVLANCTQEDVFEVVGVDVLKGALDGYNGTIMCYGQTGAGKTYTMTGNRSQGFKGRGIVPRILSALFAEARSRPDRSFNISAQYLEIYNETLYDLLDITTQPHEINVYEDARGRVTVNGLKRVAVKSEADAMALLFEGDSNRVIGEHQLNRESSRSHAIFMLRVASGPASRALNGGVGGVDTEELVAKLALVDLAGSERVSKTRSEGVVLKEAGHINKSLSILEQVILALGEKNRDHVPFRSSKLTQVLRDGLGGNSSTVLVANVWSESDQADETLSTCRFAQRMMRVTCELVQNVAADSTTATRALERRIAELQAELAMHDSLANRSSIAYGPYNAQQRDEVTRRVAAWLSSDDLEPSSGSGSEITDALEGLGPLPSLRHIREVLLACKRVYREGRGGVRSAGGGLSKALASNGSQRMAAPAINGNGRATTSARGSSAGSGCGMDDGLGAVGDDPSGSQFQSGGVGCAPRYAAPSNGRAFGESRPEVPSSPGPPPDRQAALEDYKAGPGRLKAQGLSEAKVKMKNLKRRAKDLGLSINAIKREMDGLREKADRLKSERLAQGGAEASQVLDAEEYDTVMRLKDMKARYRDEFSELAMVRSEIDYTSALVDSCLKELVTEFGVWYSSHWGGDVEDAMADIYLGGADEDEGGTTRLPPRTPTPPQATLPKGPRPGLAIVPPSPSHASSTHPSSAASTPSQAGPSSTWRGSAPAPAPSRRVLSSLVAQPDPGEEVNGDAAAYYQAANMLLTKGPLTTPNGQRASSAKKTRGAKGSFSTSQRS